MELDLYDFYKTIKAKGIIFSYSGPVAHAGLEGIAQTLRRNLEMEEAGHNATQAVFSVFIEQMQNILNYSAEHPKLADNDAESLRVGIIVVGVEEDNYFVYCGNRVLQADVANLKKRIELIRMMNKDELKSFYKERRRMEPEPGSKGAGLGLIEMARKAGQPIDFDFSAIDERFSFFSIKVVVKGEAIS